MPFCIFLSLDCAIQHSQILIQFLLFRWAALLLIFLYLHLTIIHRNSGQSSAWSLGNSTIRRVTAALDIYFHAIADKWGMFLCHDITLEFILHIPSLDSTWVWLIWCVIVPRLLHKYFSIYRRPRARYLPWLRLDVLRALSWFLVLTTCSGKSVGSHPRFEHITIFLPCLRILPCMFLYS
jgi:hypothetical protein